MRFPAIQNCEQLPNGVRLSFTVEADLDWFNGHFPKLSILPGVAMCVFVQEYTTRYLGLNLYAAFSGIVQAKFQKTILVGDVFTLTIENDSAAQIIRFTTESCGVVYVTGRIAYDPQLI